MSKRNNIMFNKPEEPAFIKRLKAAAGYVEGPDINTKRSQQCLEEREDREDRDDEKPTVVALNPGDLTAEEVDSLSKAEKEIEDDVPSDGKIRFKKPSKKSNASNPPLKASSASASAPEPEKPSSKSLKDKPSRKNAKRQKALLSFNEEDEES